MNSPQPEENPSRKDLTPSEIDRAREIANYAYYQHCGRPIVDINPTPTHQSFDPNADGIFCVFSASYTLNGSPKGANIILSGPDINSLKIRITGSDY